MDIKKPIKYSNEILESAHKHSIFQIDEIRNSSICGCFYCLTTFHPQDIVEWTDDGKTPQCPNCGIDSVLGDNSGYPVNDEIFLKEMYNRWFNSIVG